MFTRVNVSNINQLLTRAEDLGLIARWEEQFTPSGKLQFQIWHGAPKTSFVSGSDPSYHNYHGGVFDTYSVKEAATYLRGLFNAYRAPAFAG